MSTDASARVPHALSWRADVRLVRILRFALGVTVAMGLALGIGWKLSFITPVMLAGFLATPAPCPSARAGLAIVLNMAAAFAVGIVVTLLLVPYPIVCLLIIGLLLFLIFHWNLGGAPPFAIVMLLVAVTVFPVMGTQSAALVVEVAKGFLLSGAITVALVFVAHTLLPDPPASSTRAKTSAKATPLPQGERVRLSAVSTAVVFPLAALFLTFEATGAILVLVFVAILAQQPTLSSGAKGGLGLIAGNLIGGLAALIFYDLLVAVPSFHFLLLLTLLVSLLFGVQIFSGKPAAKLFATGMSTVLLLIGSGTGPIGDDTEVKFYVRIVLIMLAALYVVGATSLLESLSRRQERVNEQPASRPEVPA